jgi:hypothetical protein
MGYDIELADHHIVADPKNVKREFARQWKEIFSSKGSKKDIPTPWLNEIKGKKYHSFLDVQINKEHVLFYFIYFILYKCPLPGLLLKRHPCGGDTLYQIFNQ